MHFHDIFLRNDPEKEVAILSDLFCH